MLLTSPSSAALAVQAKAVKRAAVSVDNHMLTRIDLSRDSQSFRPMDFLPRLRVDS